MKANNFNNHDNSYSHSVTLESADGKTCIIPKAQITIYPQQDEEEDKKVEVQATSNSDVASLYESLKRKIAADGYLECPKVIKRWAVSQCLSMLDRQENGTGYCPAPRTFHRQLTDRGLEYSWKVLYEDLYRQYKMLQKHDRVAYDDSRRWYNKELAYAMAVDYIHKLMDYNFGKTVKFHKGVPYIALRTWLNNGKGVYMSELQAYYQEWKKFAEHIKNAANIQDLLDAVMQFWEMIKATHAPIAMSNAFTNVYKAYGAYYTMKDLVMFEGYAVVPGDGVGGPYVDKSQALAAIERYANDIVRAGVMTNGYRMLGMLKKMLSYNGFDYSSMTKHWEEESLKRRVARFIKQNRRSRR